MFIMSKKLFDMSIIWNQIDNTLKNEILPEELMNKKDNLL